MDFSFVHAADIHLDSPLRGLEKYEGAPIDEVRGATRRAFVNLVDFCLHEQAGFLIIAGDLYDGDWRDYNTGLFFVTQMSRLQEAGIKAFMVKGNHDAASQISRQLRLPDNVYEFPVDEPDSVFMEDLQVALHGMSFGKPAVTENLSIRYPEPYQGYLNIGILHTSAGGRAGHENYAPCRQQDLESKGYDYWALGHVHQREILKDGHPWIVFPGNLQGRHIREAGPKGCTLVRVSDGLIKKVQHHSLDILRWLPVSVDVTGTHTLDECYLLARNALEEALLQSEGRLLSLRMTFEGTCDTHMDLLNHQAEIINNLRAMTLDAGAGEMWLEKVKICTSPAFSWKEAAGQNPAYAFLLQYLEDIETKPELWKEITADLKEFQSVLPGSANGGADDFDLSNPEVIHGLLTEVEALLFNRLNQRGDGQ